MTFPPEVNIKDSQQNAFVQDWLTKYMNHYDCTSNDWARFEDMIEKIQETYNYQDHEARKNAVATGGDLDATLRVLSKLMEIVPKGDEIYQHLNLAYAFVNATKQFANKTPE